MHTVYVTYQGWFARKPEGSQCPDYWDVSMGTATLQRVFRFRMGSHMLPIEQGRHLQLPRHRRVGKRAVQAPWVTRGTCFWNAPPWQVSELNSPSSLHSPQVSWPGLYGSETNC